MLIPVIVPGRTVVRPVTPCGRPRVSPTVYPLPKVVRSKSEMIPGSDVIVNSNPEPTPPIFVNEDAEYCAYLAKFFKGEIKDDN